jgi:acetyl esterase
LLPEHHFPTQLNQIAIIYAALASGNSGPELGFDVNSIIVTGESAGGNLAAALCVKLAMHNIGVGPEDVDIDDTSSSSSSSSSSPILIDDNAEKLHRMPDAIMLSCPALNLTTELSHSRVVGTEDPVLPNALISAISDAYLPPGFDKKDPLASPHYAPDSVLRRFPPALLFASSKDPLLDDSVTFNERLSVLGVDSELIAVNNVPHAYLGLGTAGFPEAVQVQKYAVDWLSSKLR